MTRWNDAINEINEASEKYLHTLADIQIDIAAEVGLHKGNRAMAKFEKQFDKFRQELLDKQHKLCAGQRKF